MFFVLFLYLARLSCSSLHNNCSSKNSLISRVFCVGTGQEFQTLEGALLNVSTPGDHVFIRGGDHYVMSDINVNPGVSGTFQDPIVVSAYPGEIANIHVESSVNGIKLGDVSNSPVTRFWKFQSGEGELHFRRNVSIETTNFILVYDTFHLDGVFFHSGLAKSVSVQFTMWWSSHDAFIVENCYFENTQLYFSSSYVLPSALTSSFNTPSSYFGPFKRLQIIKNNFNNSNIQGTTFHSTTSSNYFFINDQFKIFSIAPAFSIFSNIMSEPNVRFENNVFENDRLNPFSDYTNYVAMINPISGNINYGVHNYTIQNNLFLCKDSDSKPVVAITKPSAPCGDFRNFVVQNNLFKGECGNTVAVIGEVQCDGICVIRENSFEQPTTFEGSFLSNYNNTMSVNPLMCEVGEKPVPFYRMMSIIPGEQFPETPLKDFEGHNRQNEQTGAFDKVYTDCFNEDTIADTTEETASETLQDTEDETASETVGDTLEETSAETLEETTEETSFDTSSETVVDTSQETENETTEETVSSVIDETSQVEETDGDTDSTPTGNQDVIFIAVFVSIFLVIVVIVILLVLCGVVLIVYISSRKKKRNETHGDETEMVKGEETETEIDTKPPQEEETLGETTK